MCDNKLKAKKKNCDFNAQLVEYLGHIVSMWTVAMDPAKISVVIELPLLTNIKLLQSFLGLCNYYNRFIKNYSQILSPLTKVLWKDTAFVWGDLQQSLFEELMHALSSTLVLLIPQLENPFTIHFNASNVAIGAVLTQRVDDMDMFVCYYSKRLNDTEAC